MARAEAATLDCDLFLVLGSSLVVYPAAGFPLLAKQNGREARHRQPRADRPGRLRRPRAARRDRPGDDRRRAGELAGYFGSRQRDDRGTPGGGGRPPQPAQASPAQAERRLTAAPPGRRLAKPACRLFGSLASLGRSAAARPEAAGRPGSASRPSSAGQVGARGAHAEPAGEEDRRPPGPAAPPGPGTCSGTGRPWSSGTGRRPRRRRPGGRAPASRRGRRGRQSQARRRGARDPLRKRCI